MRHADFAADARQCGFDRHAHGMRPARSVIDFVGDGLILGKNEEAVGRIDERPDYSYAMQVYNSMDFGAVRMEEVKVVEIVSAT